MRGAAGANGVSYYVGAHSTGSQTDLFYRTYSASSGFSSVQTIALGNSDVGPGSNDFTAQQAGTSLTLDVGDSRVQSLVYANGYLWGVSEVKPSGATATEIHWFKLNLSNPAAPTVAAQGDDISGASIGSGVGVFNPSIAVDVNGDVLLNFTASGSSLDPSDYYAVMTAGASTFGAPTLYQASTSYFQQTSGATGAQRWGTYSSAIADPDNPNDFWISNEYVTNIGVTIPSGLSAWWDTVTAQVAVSSASPPTLGGAGAMASYTQGGAAATLDSGLTVADPSSTTLSGATVAIGAGFFAGDTLGFTNQGGITGSYNATTGALTLTGSASLAAYQTALDSVTFSSTSANPTNYGADLARTINWQVSAGSLQSAVASSAVNVVGVDQPPVLSGAGNTSAYTSGGGAVAVDNALAASDPDSLKLASATVTISGNFQSGDLLQLHQPERHHRRVHSGDRRADPERRGDRRAISGGAGYGDLLDPLSANAGARTVSWQVNDGTQSSAAVTSTVAIGSSTPPTLGGGYVANWIQAVPPATTSTPVAADPSLSVTNAATVSGATIAITTGFQSGDQLAFANQNGIAGSYNATTGVLTLSGNASVTAYQTALDSITFSSTSANPTRSGADSTRVLTWKATSGAQTSAAVTSTMDLGQTYTLTTAKDTISAGAGNDTIVAPSPRTLSSNDSINGSSSRFEYLVVAGGRLLQSPVDAPQYSDRRRARSCGRND